MKIAGSVEAPAAAALAVVRSGCAVNDEAGSGQSGSADLGEVVPTPAHSTNAVKATLVVAGERAAGGCRVRADDEPLPRLTGSLAERSRVLRRAPAAFTGEEGAVSSEASRGAG